MLTKKQRTDASAARQDDGFTLVEMLVSLIVVALVAGAFMNVLVRSLDSTRGLDVRTRANQLAQDRLESVVSRPWSAVGLFATDAGYSATGSTGQPTVTLSTPRPTGAPVPSETTVVKGTSFSLRTDITWQDDPVDLLGAADRNGDIKDTKHVVVTVGWSSGGRTGQVTLDGLRIPTATEVPAVGSASAPFTVTVSAPASQGLTGSNYPTTPGITVVATTSKAASNVSLNFRTRAGPQSVAMVGSGTSWQWDLPATTGPFDIGSTLFTASASTTGSVVTGSTRVQMVAGSGSSTFTASAAPSQTLTGSFTLAQGITVSVTGGTALQSGSISYSRRDGSVATKPLSGSGTSWSALVAADTTTFAPGNLTFNVSAVFLDASTATGSTSVTLYSSELTPEVVRLEVVDAFTTVPPYESFCVNNSSALYKQTEVRVTVANVLSSDTVRLTAPVLTTTEFAMQYVSTNSDGTLLFRYFVPAGTTSFPSGSIDVTAYATKTISGQQYRDDLVKTVPVQVQKRLPDCR